MPGMLQLYPAPAGDVPDAIYDHLDLPAPPPHRPYTILNMVTTVDGKTTLDGARVNEIGSDMDHRLMIKLRVPVDAVLRGAGTVRSHGRYPSVGEEEAAARRATGRPDQPKAVIVTQSGDLPLTAPVFQAPAHRPIIITSKGLPAERMAALAAVAHVITVEGEPMDLPAAMAVLRQEYGIRHLLSEGGPYLNYWFLRHGLLDEIFWTVAPKVGGARDDLTMVDGPATLEPLPQLRLKTAYLYQPTGELFMRYRVQGGAQ